MSIPTVYLAIDHCDPATGRPMPNGIPQDQHNNIENMDGHRLDYPRLLYYLRQCNINTKIVNPESAPMGAWYPMVLGWFDFSTDYFALISTDAYTRIKQKQIKLIFTYHEGDNPARIRNRLEELCKDHNIDSSLVWLISGNSMASQVPNTVYWPELEFMYWRTVDLNAGTAFHLNPRPKHFTALCRIDKLWRSVFMSDLWANNLHHSGHFSYNQFQLGSEDNYFDCALDNEYLAGKQSQVDRFISAGPFKADDLNADQHNNYAANMDDFYGTSYFNVVLETMIDVDNSNGVFVTEKTFKPIFNNQFFIEVAAANTLSHLHELGYKTFSSQIDESYDAIVDNQQRFECVLELAKNLANKPLNELHQLYANLQTEICHNSTIFKKGMQHRLHAVVDRIMNTL